LAKEAVIRVLKQFKKCVEPSPLLKHIEEKIMNNSKIDTLHAFNEACYEETFEAFLHFLENEPRRNAMT